MGGSAASNPQAAIGLAGSNNGSNLRIARNLYTFEDRVAMTRGRHQLTFGAWFQPFQSNETIALSQYGQATFTSLPIFFKGYASFLWDPSPTEMNWRSLFGAWYAEDVIRLSPRLTLSLGFRDEFTTGWNEAHGRAANYTFTNGVISTHPQVGDSLFTTNNAKFLPQPRIGLAWSPFATRPFSARGLACITTCKMRSDIEPIRTHPSIRATALAAPPHHFIFHRCLSIPLLRRQPARSWLPAESSRI